MGLWESKKVNSLLKEKQNMDTLQKKQIILMSSEICWNKIQNLASSSLLLYMPLKALQKFLCGSFSKTKLMFSIAASFSIVFPYFLPYAASQTQKLF